MKQYLVLYFSTLLVMVCLDVMWIGVIARDFYKSRIGQWLEFHSVPAVLFYLMYGLAITIFVNARPGLSWQFTLVYGALFGFFAYATYDLTNLATLRGWPVSLAVVDMGWGTLVTALSATAGRMISNHWFSGANP